MTLVHTIDLTPEVVREAAIANGVCVRPVMQRLVDTVTGTEQLVPIACGSTRDRQCPTCAERNRRLRIQQCREGWHRTEEPDDPDDDPADDLDDDQPDDENQDDDTGQTRRVRSTRRRQDAPDLPRLPVANRTVGRTYSGNEGRVYRPSMFVTLTLPSYGPVRPDGTPVDPETYDYRRAALDAMHFPKLVDRFWQNLRRSVGYKVQYFAAVEAQKRLAPHVHAALRGVFPRELGRRVVAATYHQMWWPSFDLPVYTDQDQLPVWDERQEAYLDPTDQVPLPTFDQALDQVDDDPTAEPVHVLRFGVQTDMQGLIGGTKACDRRVGYLTKYLTKSIADTYGDDDQLSEARRQHVERLHEETRWLPCSEHCANWLRYGIQPRDPEPGLIPGECDGKAHQRENLGCGGRRVLVSRKWTGKTLTEHKADRRSAVEHVLDAAGIDLADADRCSATVVAPDGGPRFLWEPLDPKSTDLPSYRQAILAAIKERQRWREEYDSAKAQVQEGSASHSAAGSERG
ncbi:MAG: replication initiator [Nocardioidaceae bacterium]